MPRNSSSSPARNNHGGPYSSALKWKPSHTYSSPKSPVPPLLKTTPPPLLKTTPPPLQTSLPTQHHKLQMDEPDFFSNMWQGFSIGAGQSIAFNMFRSDSVVKHVYETPPPSSASTLPILNSALPKEYIQCMKESQNDEDACKQYLKQVESKLK